MPITSPGNTPEASPSQTERSKAMDPEESKATMARTEKNLKLNEMPKTTPGVTPSSVFLVRFVRGRNSGTGGTGALPLLPCELVQMIATWLPVKSLGNLRLACRELESKTFRYFAPKYFTRLRFLHSRYALEALVNLANSRMAKFVKRVGLAACNDQGLIKFPDADSTSSRKKKVILDRMWNYAEKNRQMRTLGDDSVMIRDALSRLRGVTTLEFHDFSSVDKGSKHSYGQRYHSKLGSGVASFQNTEADATQSLARLFSIAVHAAEASKLDIKCIDMLATHSGFDDGSYCSLDFPLPSLSDPQRAAAFSNLTVLRVLLGYERDIGGYGNEIDFEFRREPGDQNTRDRFLQRFTAFLSQTTVLHTLTIQFGEFLNGGDFLEGVAASGCLSKVKDFEVLHVSMESHEFCDVLQALSPNLHSLWLTDAMVADEEWVTVLTYIRDTFEDLREFRFVPEEDYCFLFAHYEGKETMTEFLNKQIPGWEAHGRRW